jgi:probable rRNA maturation factor
VIKLDLSEDFDPLPIFNFDNIKNCIISILNEYQIDKGYINIIIVSDESLRKLKKKYFNVDFFTDVMAFNLEEKGEQLDGEIYISWDRIIENAKILNQTIKEEFKRILIHGVLHLIGFDDQTKNEKSEMTALENLYISKFNLAFYS